MADTVNLKKKVQAAYSAAALEPKAPHVFPVGRQFAESLGYSRELLTTLPSLPRSPKTSWFWITAAGRAWTH